MRSVVRRLLKHRLAMAGMIVIAVFGVLAVFAAQISPYHPTRHFSLANKLEAPSSAHLLGTDELGRDLLSRILHGARTSLLMGVVAVGIGLFIGAPIGAISGYYRGALDTAIQRLVEILMAFPGILLAIVVVAVLGPGLWNAMIAVGVAFVPTYVRVMRGSVLELREREFVEAARVVGASHSGIIWRHILPNCLAPTIVLSTLQVGFVIVFEGSLSFLGVGIPRPNPAWGLMVADGRIHVVSAWWIAFFPGLAIMLTVLSVNMLGDWLRDRLDPKLTQV